MQEEYAAICDISKEEIETQMVDDIRLLAEKMGVPANEMKKMIEMLRKYNVKLSEIGARELPSITFDTPTERMRTLNPLLYQSGYITIKGYKPLLNLYLLDIPNKEVRLGLVESLLPEYIECRCRHAADRLERISRPLRLVRTAGSESHHQLRQQATYAGGLED